MGAALEWFSESERQAIAWQLLTSPEERGGKVWAACPFHQEHTVGGSFFYDPAKDHAFCYSCRASEDLVGLFCAVSGYAQQSAEGFRAFRDRFASGRALRREERPVARDKRASPARKVDPGAA